MSGRDDRESSPYDPTVVNESQSSLPDRYEVLRILGSGGMGRVLHARDRVLDREVAVKLLADRHAGDAVFAQRFLGEARAAASLNHPNIVQIYEFGHTETGAYLVMEYVDGRTLRDLMREHGRYGERRAVELIDTASLALGVAHARGIVHRDVKPDNLMLTRAGEFKLVDLGLAKAVDGDGSHTETGQSLGTPHYISPEQVLGAKAIDHRADIYSLGASLYCLATGKVPFDGSSSAHIMSRHLNDPPPDPRDTVPGLSSGFCAVVARAMAKDPAERFQDTDELREALARVRAAAAPGPDHVAEAAVMTESDSGADPELGSAELQRIEGHLARAIGPVARVLVERERRGTASRSALLHSLADQIPGDRDRRQFLRRCGLEPGSETGGSGSGSGSRAIPAPTAALDPEAVATVTRRLAEHIGPVARVLVRREAAAGGGLTELATRLAEQIPDADARRTFIADVSGLE